MSDDNIPVFLLKVEVTSRGTLEAYAEMNPYGPPESLLMVIKSMETSINQLKDEYTQRTGKDSEKELIELSNKIDITHKVIRDGPNKSEPPPVEIPCRSKRGH